MSFNHTAKLTDSIYQTVQMNMKCCKYITQLKKKKRALAKYVKDSEENALKLVHHEGFLKYQRLNWPTRKTK